jgi:hypothetical protein
VKEWIGWFCVAFGLFFAVGAIVGWLNRVPPDNGIDIVAARHVALTGKDDRNTLTYVCKGHDYFDFDLRTGALIPDKNILEHPPISRPISFESLETVVGAATGWELRGALVNATGVVLTQRQRIALLLGSVSGFYAGRWLTSTRMPSCDADEVIGRLQQVPYWDALKREKCRQLCLRYKLWFSPTDIQPLTLNVNPLIQAAREVETTNRKLIIGYLQRLDVTFRESSSNGPQPEEYDFSRIARGIPYLLVLLDDNPQVMKKAFLHRVPRLVVMPNDDQAVIDREVSENTLPLYYQSRESYQKSVLTSVLLTIGFLIAVIVASLFLISERIVKVNK